MSNSRPPQPFTWFIAIKMGLNILLGLAACWTLVHFHQSARDPDMEEQQRRMARLAREYPKIFVYSQPSSDPDGAPRLAWVQRELARCFESRPPLAISPVPYDPQQQKAQQRAQERAWADQRKAWQEKEQQACTGMLLDFAGARWPELGPALAREMSERQYRLNPTWQSRLFNHPAPTSTEVDWAPMRSLWDD